MSRIDASGRVFCTGDVVAYCSVQSLTLEQGPPKTNMGASPGGAYAECRGAGAQRRSRGQDDADRRLPIRLRLPTLLRPPHAQERPLLRVLLLWFGVLSADTGGAARPL